MFSHIVWTMIDAAELEINGGQQENMGKGVWLLVLHRLSRMTHFIAFPLSCEYVAFFSRSFFVDVAVGVTLSKSICLF